MVTTEELANRLSVVASVPRLRILGLLGAGPLHVSDLARRLGISRALLYMHIRRLEEGEFVTGELRVADDGRAYKYFALRPFHLTITAEIIIEALDNEEFGNEEE